MYGIVSNYELMSCQSILKIDNYSSCGLWRHKTTALLVTVFALSDYCRQTQPFFLIYSLCALIIGLFHQFPFYRSKHIGHTIDIGILKIKKAFQYHK